MDMKILFVCVENSCRSQMAEGFARKVGNGVWDAWSAGSKPSENVNETAVRVMKEKGIDLSHHKPKSLTDIPELRWNYVITMGCGDQCPILPGKEILDWNIPDPIYLPLHEFCQIRDRIEEEVKRLKDYVITSLFPSNPFFRPHRLSALYSTLFYCHLLWIAR